MAIGPVQLVAIGFGPDAKFEGRIIEELSRLEQSDTIRLLDLLFVHKDADSGDLVTLDAQGEDLGGIVGALLGFEFEGDDDPGKTQPAQADGHAFGLSRAQIEGLGEGLEPGTSAGIMLIEHLWAKDLKQAVRDAGGVPVAEGFLTPEVVASVAAELAAMSEAIGQLESDAAAVSG